MFFQIPASRRLINSLYNIIPPLYGLQVCLCSARLVCAQFTNLQSYFLYSVTRSKVTDLFNYKVR